LAPPRPVVGGKVAAKRSEGGREVTGVGRKESGVKAWEEKTSLQFTPFPPSEILDPSLNI